MAVVVVLTGYGSEIYFTQGPDAARNQEIVLYSSWPRLVKTEVPEHLPASIEEDYLGAMHSYEGKYWTQAAMLFRQVLERSILTVQPDAKGKLADMIKNLPPEIGGSPQLKDLAHLVRFIGNDGAHEPQGKVSEAIAKEAQEFTELFLTYVFTMPQKIKASSAYNRLKNKE